MFYSGNWWPVEQFLILMWRTGMSDTSSRATRGWINLHTALTLCMLILILKKYYRSKFTWWKCVACQTKLSWKILFYFLNKSTLFHQRTSHLDWRILHFAVMTSCRSAGTGIRKSVRLLTTSFVILTQSYWLDETSTVLRHIYIWIFTQ